MLSINENDIDFVNLKGRKYKLLADKSTIGCKNILTLVSFFPSNSQAPGHIHEKEEEVIYVLDGFGEAIIDGVSHEIKPGSVVYFPPGSLHSIDNKSDKEIKLYCVFSPQTKIGDYKDYENM